MDVTVIGRDPGPRRGIRLHRVGGIDRGEVRWRVRIPLTSPGRTLLDLGAAATGRVLEQAMAEAAVRRLADHRELAALLARHHRRRGAGALRALLEREAGPALTDSEAEERMLALIRAAGLPEPDTNVMVGRFRVDMLWRARGLVVEIDGFRFHSSAAAFERDRRRDAELTARGLRVMRVTWRQIVDEPDVVVARIRSALALGTASAPAQRM